MLASMTGFGRSILQEVARKLQIDIKSVNSRYLDINVRLPLLLNEYEILIREEIAKHITRGKVDVFVQFEDTSLTEDDIILDLSRAKSYYTALLQLSSELDIDFNLKAQDFFSFRDIFRTKDLTLKEENIAPFLIRGLNEAINNLKRQRQVEGENLCQVLHLSLEKIESSLDLVAQQSKEVFSNYQHKLKSKLLDNIKEYGLNNLSEERIILEMIIFSDKTDISEEIERLRSHLKLGREILNKGGVCGKRLDFLIQELNRETNTIASKVANSSLTSLAVDLKCEIEKMREQIQNIE